MRYVAAGLTTLFFAARVLAQDIDTSGATSGGSDSEDDNDDSIFGIFSGNGNSMSTSGNCFNNYCCDGSIIGNNGNFNDISGFTCCQGDGANNIDNRPGASCTAGTPVPLTAAAASASSMSAPSGSTTGMMSMTSMSDAMSSMSSQMSSRMSAAGQTTMTNPMATSGSNNDATASSGSTGGAAVMTAAPLMGAFAAGLAVVL